MKIGKAAGVIAAIAFLITGVVNVAEHCLHLPIGFAFVIGLLIAVVGSIVFSIATIRARALPVWIGGSILVGTLAFQLLSLQGGIYVFGAAWVAVGTGLIRRETAP